MLASAVKASWTYWNPFNDSNHLLSLLKISPFLFPLPFLLPLSLPGILHSAFQGVGPDDSYPLLELLIWETVSLVLHSPSLSIVTMGKQYTHILLSFPGTTVPPSPSLLYFHLLHFGDPSVSCVLRVLCPPLGFPSCPKAIFSYHYLSSFHPFYKVLWKIPLALILVYSVLHHLRSENL